MYDGVEKYKTCFNAVIAGYMVSLIIRKKNKVWSKSLKLISKN